jgi:hypothetical protein
LGGRTIKKNIKVHTNDKEKQTLSLTVTGAVEMFADIQPRRVRLAGVEGTKLKKEVTIKPTPKYPFNITNIRAKNGTHIKYQFEELKEPGKTGYLVTIENTKKVKGRYQDTIFLTTNSKVKPEIDIFVSGNIRVKKPERNNPVINKPAPKPTPKKELQKTQSNAPENEVKNETN